MVERGVRWSRETWRKANKLWDAAKGGNALAAEILSLLNQREMTIDGAYRRVFKAQDETSELYVRVPWGFKDATLGLHETRLFTSVN